MPLSKPSRKALKLMADYDPDIKSTEYQYLYPEWQKINAILGGTRTMREAGAEYLLRHERESQLSLIHISEPTRPY